ncbi:MULTISPECIES: ammonia-dependent NAD(+) synthetase [Paenibacillus]|uniref:NH(3)-dependent NAD(+) synthetase n=1 Tax=Paenibacillus albilobatus TaxID=2716884 RepID=A0A919XAQ8_9BACL|nr:MULTISPECIES: ammonia-dependent NAD(+) synthetase [Paenibacillus]MDR9857891.1 ammonia-dependent NAD(+) synthetase [Paenibacillus sp. VCA1]GIO29162.1 NH(3)-dependent NAD(+) synthetase [Paenibacillus albilobatus]
MSTQEQIMKELHVKPAIDAKEEIRRRVDFLKAYCKKAGAKGFVLGISGGQDSSLAGRLCQLAVEELRAEGYEASFCAVRLPFGVQKDEDDAQAALAFIKPDESVVFNIESAVNALAGTFAVSTGGELSDYHKGNVKARMRMIAQYAIGGERQCLVVGTDHAAEALTGFFTKFGDGGADVTPLTGLTKEQGRELLKELHADERLYLKVPTADLLDNKPQQADETELGMKYTIIDEYLTGKQVDTEDRAKIEQRYKNTEHKRQLPVTPFDEWWK